VGRISDKRLAELRAIEASLGNTDDDTAASHYRSDDPEIGAFLERIQREQVNYSGPFFRTTGMYRAPHRRELAGVDIACIGIPLDRGVPFDRAGTRQGPAAFRHWSSPEGGVHELTGFNVFESCSVIDWGDVEFDRQGFDLTANIAQIADAYREFGSRDIATLSVGGEHTSTYGVLQGLTLQGEKPLALIHLDAHHDTGGDHMGSRINDGSVFRLAALEGLIDPAHTIQIGIRGRVLMTLDFSRRSGMKVVTAREFQRQGAREIAKLARDVVGDRPVYLSFDTDCIDAAEMPGTTLPTPFGLSGREVRDLLDELHGLDFVGADIMELAPIYDPTGKSAALAAALGFEMLSLLGESVVARRGGERRRTHWTDAPPS
jgi:arginase family enzyme